MFKSCSTNDSLCNEVKCLYITILILIGILNSPKRIIEYVNKYIEDPEHFKDVSTSDKSSQINLMYGILKLKGSNKCKSITALQKHHNINKIYLKQEIPGNMETCHMSDIISIDGLLNSIWSHYKCPIIDDETLIEPGDIHKNCLMDLFSNSNTNKQRDLNINILDFILSNYNVNKLTHDIINHIISDKQLEYILNKYPVSSIGADLDLDTDSAQYVLDPVELHSQINFKDIDKKIYIINTIHNIYNQRGIKYKYSEKIKDPLNKDDYILKECKGR